MAHDFTLAELATILTTTKSEIKPETRYRHSKTGGEYVIVDVVINESTEKPLIIYRAEYGDELTWARELDAFTDMVELNGKTVPRFVKIEEN